MLVAGYANDPEEPVRFAVLDWDRRGGGWRAFVEWAQGHYTRIDVYALSLTPFTVSFDYMDEDTRIAANPTAPAAGEWTLVASIPFLTSFRAWADARDEFFRGPVRNRYLDYGGPLAAADWQGRLDEKYEPLMPKLQQLLFLMRHGDTTGSPFHNHPIARKLVQAKLNARHLFHVLSGDPLVASLLSQRYVDAESPRNPSPAVLTATYDYMVTTAWQPPAMRVCYIAQKIDASTTPPVKPPKHVTAVQASGSQRIANQTVYRVLCSMAGTRSAIRGWLRIFRTTILRRQTKGARRSFCLADAVL